MAKTECVNCHRTVQGVKEGKCLRCRRAAAPTSQAVAPTTE